MADTWVSLAAGRTFLAWMRTGLARMGFGFVVARFAAHRSPEAHIEATDRLAVTGLAITGYLVWVR